MAVGAVAGGLVACGSSDSTTTAASTTTTTVTPADVANSAAGASQAWQAYQDALVSGDTTVACPFMAGTWTEAECKAAIGGGTSAEAEAVLRKLSAKEAAFTFTVNGDTATPSATQVDAAGIQPFTLTYTDGTWVMTKDN